MLGMQFRLLDHIQVLSTLPHFLSILPILYNVEYICIILLSTLLSIIYHIDETDHVIMVYDYGIAFVWFLYDIYMGYHTPYLYTIITLNGISFIMNKCIYHSAWHIINASKCYYVSSLLCLKDSIK
jgi:hypothetical protein